MKRTFLIQCCLILSLSILTSQDKIIHQKADDAFRELSDSLLTLRFFNALNGNPIQNAMVTVGDIGSYTTDEEGRIEFKSTSADTVLDVTFKCKDYITSIFKAKIMVGALFFNRFSVSPALLQGSIRIVLDWDAEPSDLDAHLVKENSYHISYRDKHSATDGSALLDRDDTDGFGPETITINTIDNNGKYEFYVHNFSEMHKSNAVGLSRSKASVKVYSSTGLQKVYEVPADKTGLIWRVFQIINAKIVDVNEMTD